MIQKQLEEVFGVSFTEVEDITALRQFHHANAYCVDKAGALLGLCATEIQLETLEVPDYPALAYLNLCENKNLREVRFKAALAQLIHLDLSDGGLVSLKMQVGFEQLAWLDVARNELRQLVLQGTFTKLKYLDLSNNQLTDFSAHQFSLFPALEHLFLQKNKLPSAKQAATNESGSCLAFM